MLRNEEERLKLADKLENVERMKNITEFQKFLVLQKIAEKIEKSEVWPAPGMNHLRTLLTGYPVICWGSGHRADVRSTLAGWSNY